MKRYLLALCIPVAAVALFVAALHVYERQISTDDSAAIALGKLSAEEVGKAVVDCINHRNLFDQWWDWNNAAELNAQLGRQLSSFQHVLYGANGWHVTWMAVVSLKSDRAIAYETLGAKNGSGGTIFRRKIPARVIGSLKRCGVAYAGVYPDELPQ